jgi:hypothetical protein
MQKSTFVFPSLPVSFTGQSLISHAGVSVLTGFMDALGFGRLCEDRLGQFVPSGAKHRPGRLVGSLTALARAFRSASLERDSVPVLRTHCHEPGAVRLRL